MSVLSSHCAFDYGVNGRGIDLLSVYLRCFNQIKSSEYPNINIFYVALLFAFPRSFRYAGRNLNGCGCQGSTLGYFTFAIYNKNNNICLFCEKELNTCFLIDYNGCNLIY